MIKISDLTENKVDLERFIFHNQLMNNKKTMHFCCGKYEEAWPLINVIFTQVRNVLEQTNAMMEIFINLFNLLFLFDSLLHSRIQEFFYNSFF